MALLAEFEVPTLWEYLYNKWNSTASTVSQPIQRRGSLDDKVLPVGAVVVHVLEWPALDTLHAWEQSMSNSRRSVNTEVTLALLRALHFQCAQQLQHLSGAIITQKHWNYADQQPIRKTSDITHINRNYPKQHILHISTVITQIFMFYTTMSPCCPSKACARQSCCGLLAAAAVPHFEICVLKIQTERQQFCAEAEQFLSIPPCDHNFRAAQCATEGLCTRCHACPLQGSTQHVTQVSATSLYSLFPDIALNPQAPPSRCGQILIDSFWGSPIKNRTQWVADRSSIGSLFNHPFVVEIRVLVFNACCKDRYYQIQQWLRICTCITQFFITKHVLHKYSHITQIL